MDADTKSTLAMDKAFKALEKERGLQNPCRHCHGTKLEPCPKCNATGQKTWATNRGSRGATGTCTHCQGQGYLAGTKCSVCQRPSYKKGGRQKRLN